MGSVPLTARAPHGPSAHPGDGFQCHLSALPQLCPLPITLASLRRPQHFRLSSRSPSEINHIVLAFPQGS